MKSKRCHSFVILFFIGNVALGQESEPALAKAHYQFMHINDTSQRDKYHEDEMVLYLGRHSSYYSSYAPVKVQEQAKAQMDDPAFSGTLSIRRVGSDTPEAYYTLPDKKILRQIYALASERFLLEEDFPELDWKIVEGTKEIGGYSCQKAEVYFKGRNYTAWFAPDIPFQAGPWKLHGLPGLILEAKDSTGEVAFAYQGFDKMDNSEFLVEIPPNTIKTDKKTIEKQIAAYNKNPSAYMKARSQGGGSGVSSPLNNLDPSKIKSINVVREGVRKSSTTNSPLELKD